MTSYLLPGFVPVYLVVVRGQGPRRVLKMRGDVENGASRMHPATGVKLMLFKTKFYILNSCYDCYGLFLAAIIGKVTQVKMIRTLL